MAAIFAADVAGYARVMAQMGAVHGYDTVGLTRVDTNEIADVLLVIGALTS